jgi:hypothetical protein
MCIPSMFSLLPQSLFQQALSYAIPQQIIPLNDIPISLLRKDELATNPSAIPLIFHPSFSKANLGYQLSKNPHPTAISYLLAHPEEIDYETFCLHNDDRAVQYILTMSSYFRPDDHYWYLMAQNQNDRMVDFFIHSSSTLTEDMYKGLGMNPNERVVTFLFEQGKQDYLSCSHSNDRVIDYFLANPDKIVLEEFMRNPHDKAVEYVFHYWYKHGIVDKHTNRIHNTTQIPWFALCQNSNNRMVDFVLQYKQCVNWYAMMHNPNPRVIPHVIRFFTQTHCVRALSSYPHIFQCVDDKKVMEEYKQVLI